MSKDSDLREKRIGFIGGGNMAEAIIKGLLAGGMTAAALEVSDPSPERRSLIASTYGVKADTDNVSLLTSCDVIVLAVKPQVCKPVLEELARSPLDGKTFISIMAGIRTDALEAGLGGNAHVIRVMPNTPALVLEGASALCSGKTTTAEDMALAVEVFGMVGTTATITENLMDAVTGLSGSGPAYVFSFIESLADAGVKNGLPRDTALKLASQTVFGAAKLLLETGEHPAVLRDKVTSPGGTTIAGLHAMEERGFRSAVMAAVDKATARSKELSA
jgi:pyrroline-5-carboxylate reductase